MRLFLYSLLLSFIIQEHCLAQKNNDSEADYDVAVDLYSYCEDKNSIHKNESKTEADVCTDCEKNNVNESLPKTLEQLSKVLPSEKKLDACEMLNIYNDAHKNQPDKGEITAYQRDADGKKWKVRLYFGPTKTKYYPTRVHLKSSKVNVVINDFSFAERTGMHHYNVSKWKNSGDALTWIDEPTNTIILEFQKEKNVFFLNMFHPKFLTNASDVESQKGFVQGEAFGNFYNNKMLVSDDKATSNKQLGIKLKNTHKQMDWQLGYGRRISLNKIGASNAYLSPHVAAGITTGQTQSSYKDDHGRVEEYKSSGEIQGANFSCGARLEYELGRCSFFVDNSVTFSKLKHPFLDGTATYDMKYNTQTAGIAVQLTRYKKKKK